MIRTLVMTVLSLNITISFATVDPTEEKLKAEHEYHVAAMAERYEKDLESCQKIDGATTLTQPSQRSDSQLECTDYKCVLTIEDSFDPSGWETTCRMREAAASSTTSNSDLSCNISDSNPRAVDCSDGKTYQLDSGSVSNSSFEDTFRSLGGSSAPTSILPASYRD